MRNSILFALAASALVIVALLVVIDVSSFAHSVLTEPIGLYSAMAVTPATLFGTEMTKLTGNVGGGLNQQIESYLDGKERCFISNLTFAAQANGSVIGMARIRTPFSMVGITLLTSVTLATATISLGNAGDGNAAKYKAAAVFTTADTPTSVGLAASLGVPQLVGYDCLTGSATTYDIAGNGGGGYEDIILTVGVAALPAAGTLRIFFRYMID